MCILVYQTNACCYCTTSRLLICKDHIAHTYNQVDTAPCPKARHYRIQLLQSPCDITRKCPELHEEITVCEHWRGVRKHRAKFMFLERQTEKNKNALCHHDEFRMSRYHVCGLGKGCNDEWRHLPAGEVNWAEFVTQQTTELSEGDEPFAQPTEDQIEEGEHVAKKLRLEDLSIKEDAEMA